MAGGPPTIDLWDMKPGSNNGGPHRPKPTAASGIEITEHLPNVAKQFKHLSIIRSLNSKEGDHNRGTQMMNTGRQPNPLLDYPSIGSVLSFYQAQDVEAMKNADLPAFISVGGPRGGAGFLGMKYAPFNVQNAGSPPENVKSPVDDARTARRKVLFDRVESGFNTNARHGRGPRPQGGLREGSQPRRLVAKGRVQPRQGRGRQADQYQVEGRVRQRWFRPRGLARPQAGRSRHRRRADHPRRLGPPQQHPLLASAAEHAAQPRPSDGNAGQGFERSRQAQGHRDRVDGRLRPHAAHQPERRSRSLEPLLVGGPGRWQRSRAAWSYGATNADGTGIAKDETSVADLYGTLYRGLGIDPTPETNASVRDNLGRPYYIASEKPNEKTGSYWIKSLVS